MNSTIKYTRNLCSKLYSIYLLSCSLFIFLTVPTYASSSPAPVSIRSTFTSGFFSVQRCLINAFIFSLKFENLNDSSSRRTSQIFLLWSSNLPKQTDLCRWICPLIYYLNHSWSILYGQKDQTIFIKKSKYMTTPNFSEKIAFILFLSITDTLNLSERVLSKLLICLRQMYIVYGDRLSRPLGSDTLQQFLLVVLI